MLSLDRLTTSMKHPIKCAGATILIVAGCVAFLTMASSVASDRDHDPLGQVLVLLRELRDNVSNLEREVQQIQTGIGGRSSSTLSTGPFGLPANAASVDWLLVNDSATTQTVTVTVFRLSGIGPKTVVPPGALTVAVGPGEVLHNGNSVGTGQPFEPGFDYEMVLQTTNANVLPRAVIWEDFGNTQIPGTLIPAGSWVRLQ
jgi:hypothetical protein